MPHVADCAGSEGAAAFGCALLTSYLFLFIQCVQQLQTQRATDASGSFYRKTYKAGAAKRAAAGVRGSAKSKVRRTASKARVQELISPQ